MINEVKNNLNLIFKLVDFIDEIDVSEEFSPKLYEVKFYNRPLKDVVLNDFLKLFSSLALADEEINDDEIKAINQVFNTEFTIKDIIGKSYELDELKELPESLIIFSEYDKIIKRAFDFNNEKYNWKASFSLLDAFNICGEIFALSDNDSRDLYFMDTITRQWTKSLKKYQLEISEKFTPDFDRFVKQQDDSIITNIKSIE